MLKIKLHKENQFINRTNLLTYYTISQHPIKAAFYLFYMLLHLLSYCILTVESCQIITYFFVEEGYQRKSDPDKQEEKGPSQILEW